MMGDALQLGSAFLGGSALGSAYLAMLWTAVRRLPQRRRVGLRLTAGAALRLGLFLAGTYWLAEGDGGRLVASVLGFVAIRSIAVGWIGAAGPGARARITWGFERHAD